MVRRCAEEDILFMPSRLFEQYLIKKGYITREMSHEAVEMASAIEPPLIAVAISKGCLSEEQLSHLGVAACHLVKP